MLSGRSPWNLRSMRRTYFFSFRRSQTSYWSVSADIAGDRSGVVSGVMNTGSQVGGAVTASLTPWLAARVGWNGAFDFAAALAVGGALLWLLVNPAPSNAVPGVSPGSSQIHSLNCSGRAHT